MFVKMRMSARFNDVSEQIASVVSNLGRMEARCKSLDSRLAEMDALDISAISISNPESFYDA